LLFNELQKNELIEKVYSTEANFLLVKTPYAKELTSWFSHHGIAIRDFPANSLLHDHLRITVGEEQQNQLLIDTLSSFIKNIQDLKNAKNLIY